MFHEGTYDENTAPHKPPKLNIEANLILVYDPPLTVGVI